MPWPCLGTLAPWALALCASRAFSMLRLAASFWRAVAMTAPPGSGAGSVRQALPVSCRGIPVPRFRPAAPGSAITMDAHFLAELGQQLRVDSVRASAAANSGHPTSSMSAADLMAVLLARHFRYDFTDPHAAGNDHLIFSKGHASPLLYSMFRAAGAINDDELLSYRTRGSLLEGHPTPRLPGADGATGSLG